MMAVDGKGRVPSPDRVLAAYAKYVVKANGRGIVVTHVGASMSVDEAVEVVGGTVVRSKVGDVHIAEAMSVHDAVFGGEPVGAWIHPDVHMCPDGLLSALRLMLALEAEGKTLSEFVEDIPEYPILRDKVQCSNEAKGSAMESMSKLEGEFGDIKEISTVDGVRLQLEDGWALIRPSGTEPIIRITVEAQEKDRAKELLETSRRFVSAVVGG
jgi:phosphoglucosamine mutase